MPQVFAFRDPTAQKIMRSPIGVLQRLSNKQKQKQGINLTKFKPVVTLGGKAGVERERGTQAGQ